MGKNVLCNKIRRDELKPGDHIYYWIGINVYAHHGIYIGNGLVIHYHRRPGEGIGVNKSSSDRKIARWSPSTPVGICCERCADQPDYGNGINCSCLDCFLSGAKLRRFRYAVSKAVFFAQARGGTCTMAHSDLPDDVVHRAKYLFRHGFGRYNLFKNNCEDFAIYCKTGWVIRAKASRSGQIASLKASGVGGLTSLTGGVPASIGVGIEKAMDTVPVAVAFQELGVELSAVTLTTPYFFVGCVGIGLVLACGAYCHYRYRGDMGVRLDIDRVRVEDLASYLMSLQASS